MPKATFLFEGLYQDLGAFCSGIRILQSAMGRDHLTS
jgi:hypothetical protein